MQSPEQPPLTFEKAVQSLQNRPFVEGPGFRELRLLTSDEAHEDVRLFVAAFVRRAKRLYVPLHVDTLFLMRAVHDPTGFRSVSIVHAVRGDDLHDYEWRILGHLGTEVAGALGVKIAWGGMVQPARWQLLAE